MTEVEWLSAEYPMLESGLCSRSQRKLHLFACACCRLVWNLVTDERARAAFDVVERFIEGHATQDELSAAGSVTYYGASEPGEIGRSMELVRWTVGGSYHGSARRASSRAAVAVAYEADTSGSYGRGPPGSSPVAEAVEAREYSRHAKLLRDIF